MHITPPRIIIIMGVSGSGKSTIGQKLAEALALPFYDGDQYHPETNIAKMKSGIPLNDADRQGWLGRLHTLAAESAKDKGCVIACSALKEQYRGLLMKGIARHVKWILLKGEYALIKERLELRQDHFMPPGLLDSQFATLEIPEYAITVSIVQTPDLIVKEIIKSLAQSQLGIIGLGVMGRSLALNFADQGYALSLFNRRVAGKEENIAHALVAAHDTLEHAQGFESLEDFVASLQTPRRILLMIDAGPAIDDIIEKLKPLLSPGDVIADCGNTLFTDTIRRQAALKEHNIALLGVGISGGESGARFGPSMMPGGDANGYARFQFFFDSIAARDKNGRPCSAHIGQGGAGHFVKMVHNGIEYAEMQLIAEAYGVLRHGSGLHPEQIATIIEEWCGNKNDSYLLQITAQILRKQEGTGWLIDQISDVAKSKGTGGWTVKAAADLGFPFPVVSAAVNARFLSSQTRRSVDSKHHTSASFESTLLGDALYAARIINHHLGFELLRSASHQYAWNLTLKDIARIWTNGCIIRSAFMESLVDVLPNEILFHQTTQAQLHSAHQALTDLCIYGAQQSISLPCHSAALQFLNATIRDQPTANVIQAQRDFFGAHGFERIDDPSGKLYHHNWKSDGENKAV